MNVNRSLARITTHVWMMLMVTLVKCSEDGYCETGSVTPGSSTANYGKGETGSVTPASTTSTNYGKEGDSEEDGVCLPVPCQNNATCQEDDEGGYSCQCLQGFTGVHCEISKLHSLVAFRCTIIFEVAFIAVHTINHKKALIRTVEFGIYPSHVLFQLHFFAVIPFSLVLQITCMQLFIIS